MQKGPEKDRRWVTAHSDLPPGWSSGESSAEGQSVSGCTESLKRWHPSLREGWPQARKRGSQWQHTRADKESPFAFCEVQIKHRFLNVKKSVAGLGFSYFSSLGVLSSFNWQFMFWFTSKGFSSKVAKPQGLREALCLPCTCKAAGWVFTEDGRSSGFHFFKYATCFEASVERFWKMTELPEGRTWTACPWT